ncbi:MAG: cytoplasmic protein [Rhodocyclaceae bacterium]|nr:cytoplasmic protein [Rhodocyclaceae bacterium]
MIDHAKVRRESLRWYLLLALYNARPEDMCEEHLQMIATGIFPDATPIEVRQQLDYLGDRALVEVRKEPGGRWWAGLTRHGTDMCEYTIDCEPGIARPAKYWAG